ncbi:thiol peroxidase [Desulfoluna butyratoxydans]|uniref:Thiol peroxidase n=1 Tax=Desulfoluna butyratoxydans TaxID=231438 RepID=A0A4U8YPN8_9BACT|nr:thiol peroxidase [Desulfoluna butyratoxydans]VFQ45674.1 redoxin [Desulfoluna butyratoxydans]
MAVIMIGGTPANTTGNLPDVGSKAPGFTLTKTDLTDVSLPDLAGKRIVLNIFPSIDTPVCSASVRRFNQEAASLANTQVLSVSADLPFAHKRFCETEGIDGVTPVSELRTRGFGDAYGVRIAEGPLQGLLARAVVVLDEEGTVIYSSFSKDLKEEPPYDEILASLA